MIIREGRHDCALNEHLSEQVREAAALRLEVLESEERKKEMEEELKKMYDPTVNSPRRNELKRKLKVYEETLEMMVKKLVGG